MPPMFLGHAAFKQLAVVRDAVKKLKNAQLAFNQALSHQAMASGFDAGITVINGALHTAVFGVDVSATPRLVHDGDSDFALEYTFHTDAEPRARFFQFYLRSDGKLVSRVGTPDIGWSAHDSDRVSADILVRLTLKALSSALFNPNPLPGAIPADPPA